MGLRNTGELIVCLILFVLCNSGEAKPKGASLTLKARFNATSYLLEAVEFLAEEDGALVWPFLDRLSAPAVVAAGQAANDEQCWRNITRAAAELVTPGVAKLIPLVLGSRQYAAKVQMVRQLAEQFHPDESTCCYVSVDGRVATTPLLLADLLRAKPGDRVAFRSYSPSEQLFSFDHVYTGSAALHSTSNPRVAVLYGSPGLPCFGPLHQQLKRAAADSNGRLVYVFRPLLHPMCEEFSGCARAGTGGQLLLPGWGVEAALKNTEYSAMDEKEAAQQRQQQQQQEEADDGDASSGPSAHPFGTGDAAVVKGFRLDVLAERRPHLRQELLTFRDQLLAADDEEAAVKVWDLRDVGLQATQRILGSSDPLGLLAELSQNFPGLVSSLSRQVVNSSLRAAVSHNQQYLSAGGNFMLINGLSVDVNNLDYYGFLSRLRAEMRLRDSLQGGPLELSPGLAQKIMALRAEEGAEGAGGDGNEEPRLSLGSSSTLAKHVAFINDLERDSRYQRFGYSIAELLNTFPGRLRPLARNVFTVVLVVEPLCSASLELAMSIERMHQGGYPIRFGVVFNLPSVIARVVTQRRYPSMKPGLPSWAEMDTSERFGRAFATLREAFGPVAAWRLWTTAAEEIASGDTQDPATLVDMAFTSAWSAAARSPPPGARAKAAARKSPEAALEMLREGAGYAAEVGMQLNDVATWLLARGLVQPPAAGALTAAAAAAKAGGADAAGQAAAAEAAAKASSSEGGCEAPPVVWMNGLVMRPAASAAEDLLYRVMGEMQTLQGAIFYGRLDDHTAGGDVLAAVLGLHGAVERLNPKIVGPKAKNAQVVPLAPLLRHPAHSELLPLYPEKAAAFKPPAGAKSASAPRVTPVTHYVAADLASEEGRVLVAESLSYLKSLRPSQSREARLVLVFNPLDPEAAPPVLEAVIVAALQQADTPPARDAVLAFLHRLMADTALVARLGEELAHGSAEEAHVAVKYAESAGLDSKRILSYILRLEDEALLPGGSVRGPPPSAAYRASHADLCRSVLKLEPGEAAVVSNGRVTSVYQPNGEAMELLSEDFPLLQRAVGGTVTVGLARELEEAHANQGPLKNVPPGLTSLESLDALSEMVAAVSSALAAAAGAAAKDASGVGGGGSRMSSGSSAQQQQMLGMLRGQALQVAGSPDPPFHLEAVLNPLTRTAQRLSGLLLLLREALGPSMTLTLNPQRDITEMPLKSYYRYALPQGVSPGGGPPGAPLTYFARLPSRRVLTLNMDVPEAWLVEPAVALYDLDNLRLEDVEGDVAYAEYELDSLMLTGSCVDVTASGRMTPPRGLQLHLGTPAQPHQVDTLVMANLAYFQLKAAPGRWILSLAPGRSRELYTLQSSTGTSLESIADEEDEAPAPPVGAVPGGGDGISTQVLISSFLGRHMILRVRKRPGMEGEDILQADVEPDSTAELYGEEDDEYEDDDEEEKATSGGILGRVSSMLGGGKGKDKDKGADRQAVRKRGGDTINVFTVASGHMYERLQKIMILSVIRQTKSKVKFWIIKNYMSPQHKQVIPALADKYGFEYEFVTYKWPQWLHKQTDKQRLIWAYKILFLDVLFPLGLERIIFVDSDQVVRSDLAELYHMDIKGAPYAYTPFCDNNKEMDEYRFWKGGFWRDHLQGKPYHISALYLVDLKRFRQIAAGDQLRVVYDQLSKDPNSLANLDQDLPNYAQNSIRIYSLPQEWLWCESWCGNVTKAQAKTIDLCNNPRTKEPKLTAARRIIGPLWEELDRNQEAVTKEVQQSLIEAEEAVVSAQAPASALEERQQEQLQQLETEAEREQEREQGPGGEGEGREEDWAWQGEAEGADGAAAPAVLGDRTEF